MNGVICPVSVFRGEGLMAGNTRGEWENSRLVF